MSSVFHRVALIGRPKSPGIAASLRELHALLESRGCEVCVEANTAATMGAGTAVPMEEIGARSDLVIVVGGDGTMLAAARALAAHRVPLAGVNQGRVGFMTDIALSDLAASIGAILDGRYTVEERALLAAEIRRVDGELLSTVALNEAVLARGTQGRLIEFELHLDGDYVYTLRADGFIVATPTGSTAYALSAQGPILHPAVPALALVPLNPHTLSARPVSISDRSRVEIVLLRGEDARVHFDGFAFADLREGDRLLLRRSNDSVRFIHPPGYNYFLMLREKLRWSETVDRPGDPD